MKSKQTGYDEWKTTNPADEELGPEPVEDTESGGAYREIIRQLKEENAHFAWLDKDKTALITELGAAASLYLSLDGSDKIYDAVKLQGARVKLRAEIQRAKDVTK